MVGTIILCNRDVVDTPLTYQVHVVQIITSLDVVPGVIHALLEKENALTLMIVKVI